MLRALIVAGIAAVAGHQLYKRGLLDRFARDLKTRADDLKRTVEDKRLGKRAAHEAAGGPGGGPIRPVAVHNHKLTPTTRSGTA